MTVQGLAVVTGSQPSVQGERRLQVGDRSTTTATEGGGVLVILMAPMRTYRGRVCGGVSWVGKRELPCQRSVCGEGCVAASQHTRSRIFVTMGLPRLLSRPGGE